MSWHWPHKHSGSISTEFGRSLLLFLHSAAARSPSYLQNSLQNNGFSASPRVFPAPGSPPHWQSSLRILNLLLIDPRHPIHFQQATSAPIKTGALLIAGFSSSCWSHKSKQKYLKSNCKKSTGKNKIALCFYSVKLKGKYYRSFLCIVLYYFIPVHLPWCDHGVPQSK